ncbi:MAG: Nif3-like dinuclear metal center hexameric protein, partial [Clostridia bacterium]|nr:Nif3-like dinuclear metal center hexameric protein [Clostridia bacterium]
MSVTIDQFLQCMNDIAPEKLAEKWDNGGVQIDTHNEKFEKILVCMEITDEIIKEAIDKKADMIITHHPLIFSPIQSIQKDWTGRTIVKLIQNNISVYSSHTSFDSVIGGNNDYLAKLLNISEVSTIEEQKGEKFFKIIVYVPKEALEPVRNSFFQAGAGDINDYKYCSFCSQGVGTFMPLDDAAPYIGHNNELSYVDEYKLESIVPESKLKKVIKEMLEAHPYEEPAYDIFLMENV